MHKPEATAGVTLLSPPLAPPVPSRNGNRLQPAPLTAITTPPAASSPGLVPLTV